LWCPEGFSAKCRHFVAWFWDPFVMSCHLLSEMWIFCHRIFLHVGVCVVCVCVLVHQLMDQCLVCPNLT
jgi:hypothetical protein